MFSASSCGFESLVSAPLALAVFSMSRCMYVYLLKYPIEIAYLMFTMCVHTINLTIIHDHVKHGLLC